MAKKSALEIHIEESNKKFDALETRVSNIEQDVSTLKDGMDKILKALNIN